MRLKTLTLGLLLAAALAIPASAKTFKTPQALLKALYVFSLDTTSADPDAPSLYSDYFSDNLNGLLKADQASVEPGEVGALDFDPVIAGQDGVPSEVAVGEPIVIDDTAELEVTFTNGEPVTLYYSLVKEHGGWKVDDIANQQGEFPWSLSAILAPAQ